MRDHRGSARVRRCAVCHRRRAVCLRRCRSVGTLPPKSAAERLGCPDVVTTGTGATLIEARYRNFQRWITSVTPVRSCRQVLTRDFRRVRLWFRHVYFQSARGCPGGRIGGFVERLWWLGQRVLGSHHVCFDAGVNFRLDVGIGLGFDINFLDCRRRRQLGYQPTKRRYQQHAERWCAEHAGDLTSNHAAHDAHREERKAWHRL